MIEDLYKTIKDSKSFMDEHYHGSDAKLVVCLSYRQIEFILQVCELAILLAKLTRRKPK